MSGRKLNHVRGVMIGARRPAKTRGMSARRIFNNPLDAEQPQPVRTTLVAPTPAKDTMQTYPVTTTRFPPPM